MTNTTSAESDRQDVSARQFRILDLFAGITIAAMGVAVVAPFLRRLPAEQQRGILLTIALEAVIVLGVVVIVGMKRKATLLKSGRWIGRVYFGNVGWRYWPVFLSCMQMLGVTIVQLVLAFAIYLSDPSELLRFPGVVQFVWVYGTTGYVVSRFMWRVYPNSAEVFERGVVQAGVTFFEWERVGVRGSTIFPDRMVFLFREKADSKAAITKTFLAPASVREFIEHTVVTTNATGPPSDSEAGEST